MALIAKRAAMAAAVLALAACGGSEPGAAKKPAGAGGDVFTVVVDGSSTVYPISEAAAEAYQADQGGRIRVTVAESSTGGGFRKFCRGETQVQGASRPILLDEMKTCAEAGVTVIELPIAFGALSVVVNPENPVKDLTIEELKKIWAPEAEGKVKTWKQVNAKFPDVALTLYGPGTASGTFDYFTEAVVGKAKAARTDFTPSEDDNVLVQGVSSDKGALAYFGMAYYTENKARVRALGISYQGKPPVYPTAETVCAPSAPVRHVWTSGNRGWCLIF
jgi:phosphate transport system substrate-binding protein